MLKKECEVYGIWHGMKSRCRNPNDPSFANYGGRGIRVCDRWLDIWAFESDMGPRPAGYTLDRIDNDGDYTPENCRWADKKTQQRNQRWTRYVVIDGVTHKAVELAEKIGIKTDTLVARVESGWSKEDIMKKDVPRSLSDSHKAALKAGQQKSTKFVTHCKKGHLRTKENTYITPQGWKQCQVCKGRVK